MTGGDKMSKCKTNKSAEFAKEVSPSVKESQNTNNTNKNNRPKTKSCGCS
jgi:hypothetical protein